MAQIRYFWISLPIGLILGLFIPDESLIVRLLLGLIIALPVLFIVMIIQFYYHSYLFDKYGFLRSEKKFISLILKLAAAVAVVDGELQSSEKSRLKNQLDKAYSEELSAKYMTEFEGYLNEKIPIRELCKIVDYEFDDATKGYLFFLLVSLITADGLLKESESKLIMEIASLAKIRAQTVNTVFNLFTFQREFKEHKESNKTEHKKPSKNLLEKAYDILAVQSNCEDAAVKKAYRKLAKLHHPDKFAHLGDDFISQAQQKFQTIVAAYDCIKLARGMN